MQFDELADSEQFLLSIEGNTRYYVKLFAEAADSLMPAPARSDMPSDVFDVLLQQVCHSSAPIRRGPYYDIPLEAAIGKFRYA